MGKSDSGISDEYQRKGNEHKYAKSLTDAPSPLPYLLSRSSSPQELAVSMEGDEVLHNGLHSSARSLDPDNEISTLTDTIDVLITTGNIHATPRSPPTCHEILIQYGACYLQAGTIMTRRQFAKS